MLQDPYTRFGESRSLSVSSRDAMEISVFPSFGYFVAHNLTSGIDTELGEVINNVATRIFWNRPEEEYDEDLHQFVKLSQLRGLIDENISKEDFKCAFLDEVRRQLDGYLGSNWNCVDLIIEANQKFEFGSINESCYGDMIQEIGTSDFDKTLNICNKLLVWFYASYCPSCRKMAGDFHNAAKKLQGTAVLAKTNGNLNPELVKRFNVKGYPTIMLFVDKKVVDTFPSKTELRRTDAFIDFVKKDGKVSTKSRFRAKSNWQRLFIAWRIREAEQKLVAQRKIKTLIHKYQALGAMNTIYNENGICTNAILNESRFSSGKPNPMIFFLGGGMGAGKSSIINELRKTEFMKSFGSTVVNIEADAFKVHDPVYKDLEEDFIEAAAFVHSHSVRSAEELFLTAVSERRDIVFDGTMSWFPFIEQTITMVRDTKHEYKRGIGYVKKDDNKNKKNDNDDNNNNNNDDDDDDTTIENYWEIVRICDKEKRPYEIVMIGVTIQPHIAVNRGIIRKLLTGRGVPIGRQLRSHKMFTENFHLYIPLFNKITLYDNTSTHPIIIAEKVDNDSDLNIIESSLYEAFCRRATLNETASGVKELFNGTNQVPKEWIEARERSKSFVDFNHLIDKTRKKMKETNLY